MYWIAPVKSSKLLPPMRVSSCPAYLHPDPVISLINQIRHPSGLGFSLNGSCGLNSGFGQAPLVWVGWHWLSLSCGSCEDPVIEGTKGWGASFYSSAAFPPRKLARSVGGEGASPKSPRLNWTCFCMGPKDGHSATSVCGEGGHPLACVGALPLHIQLFRFSLLGVELKITHGVVNPLVSGMGAQMTW